MPLVPRSDLDDLPTRNRLASVDAFRGATVAAMLLVNNPGTWSAIYPPLQHAEWHGWTPTDLVFPFFLFVVGVTTYLAPKSDRRAIRRGLLIVLFGLLLNTFPFFWWGKMPAVDAPTFLDRVIWRFEHLRFAGVLQRIGIVYMITALVMMRTRRHRHLVIIAAILLGYWLILTRGPLEPPEATIAARVDRAVLGTNHIWSASKTWDPEGPLSTIPAAATAMLGFVSGYLVSSRKAGRLAVWGAAGVVAGLLWGRYFPINKNLWTSSYVVFTAGCAALALALMIWVVDVKGWKRWSTPFIVFGVNPLVAFLGTGIMARCIGSLIKIDFRGKRMSLHQASYEAFYAPYFDPRFGSLLWALSFVLLWLAILTVMYRRRWMLRV